MNPIKMNKTLLLILTALTVLSIVSCKPSEKTAPASLELSLSEVSFSNDGGEKSVSVSSSPAEWKAIPLKNYDWLGVKQDQGKLLLHIDANPNATSRVAAIMVMAQEARKVLRVKQDGSATEVMVEQQELAFSLSGGKKNLRIDSNGTWTAQLEGGQDWVKIALQSVELKKVVIDVAPNEQGSAPREAKLKIVSEGGEQIVLIKQMGVTRFLLPMPPAEATSKEVIKDFEVNRGGVVFFENTGNSEYNLEGGITVATQSPVMSTIEYWYYRDVKTYKEARVTVQGARVYQEILSSDFDTYLKEHGYRLTYKIPSQRDYRSDDLHLRMEIVDEEDGVILRFFPVVKTNRPTLVGFNMVPIKELLLSDTPKTFKDIEEWEKAQGSELIRTEMNPSSAYKNQIWQQTYRVKDHPNHTVMRIYRYKCNYPGNPLPENRVGEVAYFTEVMDKPGVLFEEDNFTITREFSELLEREGFKLIENNDPYSNPEYLRITDRVKVMPDPYVITNPDTYESAAGLLWSVDLKTNE